MQISIAISMDMNIDNFNWFAWNVSAWVQSKSERASGAWPQFNFKNIYFALYLSDVTKLMDKLCTLIIEPKNKQFSNACNRRISFSTKLRFYNQNECSIIRMKQRLNAMLLISLDWILIYSFQLRSTEISIKNRCKFKFFHKLFTQNIINKCLLCA